MIKSNRTKTDIVILIFLLFVGIGSICIFFYLHFSQDINISLNQANESKTTADLRLYVLYGLAKLVMIIVGLAFLSSVAYQFLNFHPNNYGMGRNSKNEKSD
jgi:flagellar basal body-associated protein FliL